MARFRRVGRVLCVVLAVVVALILGGWAAGMDRPLGRQMLRWGIGAWFGRWQTIDKPTPREDALLRRLAPILSFEYPFREVDQATAQRSVLTGWAAERLGPDESPQRLVVIFGKSIETGRQIEVRARPDGTIFHLSSYTSVTAPSLSAPTRYPKWEDYPEETRMRAETQLASTTLALTGRALRIADADMVRMDNGNPYCFWYRGQDGVRFEEDKYYVVFSMRDMQVSHYMDDNVSWVKGDSRATFPQAEAESQARKKTASYSYRKYTHGPIGENGYTIHPPKTELCFATPRPSGIQGLVWRKAVRLFVDEPQSLLAPPRPARLVYRVEHRFSPPPNTNGPTGPMVVWVDAHTGKTLAWEVAGGINIR